MAALCHAVRRAVIDIGTNTVKLLVADVTDGTVQPVLTCEAATRIGEGLHQTHRLAPAPIARTVAAIQQFINDARAAGAVDIHAFATSAVRDAANRDEFLAACPLPVEVLTGEREAALIFRGAASDPAWASQRLLVLDVGGGSAELIQGTAARIEKLRSLPLGAVRLKEMFPDEEFAALVQYLRQTLQPVVREFDAAGCRLIGTGGGICVLARLATGQVDHAVLTLEDLRAWVTRLHALPLPQRRQVPGLPPDRADIIVHGGMVFVTALELLGATHLTVSVRSLRYGALAEQPATATGESA